MQSLPCICLNESCFSFAGAKAEVEVNAGIKVVDRVANTMKGLEGIEDR